MPEIEGDIPLADKERLRDDILATKLPEMGSAPRRDERAHQGQTARKILTILFDAHKNGTPLTQGQIAHKLKRVGAEEGFSDGASNVRIAVGRLRKLLEEYFIDHNDPQQLRLEIPKGSYALRFFRGGLNVYDWFWAQYHHPESEPLFGLLVPGSTNRVQFPSSARFMEAYWHFARLIRSKGRDLPVLPQGWTEDKRLITKITRYTCSIVVGDDTCMEYLPSREEGVEQIMAALAERYLHPFYLSRDYKNFSPFSWFRFTNSREEISHPSSPPLYKESVAFAHVKRVKKWYHGDPVADWGDIRASDTEDLAHVVLTRRSTSQINATTLICSADPRATSAVAALVCSREGLKQIAAHSSFQSATTFPDGTSKSFQIVFEVNRLALCTALDPVWKAVKVVELHVE